MVPQRGRQLSYRMAGFRVANTVVDGSPVSTVDDKFSPFCHNPAVMEQQPLYSDRAREAPLL